MTKIKRSHPGATLRVEIKSRKLTISEAARRLGVSRSSLSEVISEQAQISTNLAVRLEKAGVSSAQFWLTLQLNYNLAKAEKQKRRMKVIPLAAE